MALPTLELINCPNCRSSNHVPWATELGYVTVRCLQCALLYVNPRPTLDVVASAVTTGMHGHEDVSARRVGSKVRRYRRLLGVLFSDLWTNGRPISWLDVGAGYGEVVEAVMALAPPGSVIEGLEPMRPKALRAQARGLPVTQAWLSADHARVDVVSLVDVFSHIPDFGAFLEDIRSVLRPGGELFLETGNLADVSIRDEFPNELGLPDHLVFAGEPQVQAFLKRAGFEIVRIQRLRFDDLLQFAKNIVKKVLGRPVLLRLPYRSRYRQLLIRAKLSS